MAVTLGGDPCYPLLALAPLPEEIDPCVYGAFLRGRPMDMARCRTIELDVPADCDLVIEGHLEPDDEAVQLGPLAGPGGLYQRPAPAPVMRVTAVTHRVNPLFPTIIGGRPPHERWVLEQAVARLALPWARRRVPELVDYHAPDFATAPTLSSRPFDSHARGRRGKWPAACGRSSR